MEVTTSTAAATRSAYCATNPKHDFLVQVPESSSAGIRIHSGHSIVINGVTTADTTGMTVAIGGSIRLPGSGQTWLIGTVTDATAANFEIMACESDRR